ncbi:ATP-binding cassette domain-containing protein [Bacillus solitudinis]|nr:ATP-binding cassette domain-containing protein [Bacillus solitudinis]
MKLCFNKLVTELNHQAIIQDVRFDRNEGEFVGVVGPNGSGKSTL